jgi:hypothetical protein
MGARKQINGKKNSKDILFQKKKLVDIPRFT